MEPLFSTGTGWLLIVLYAAAVVGLTVAVTRLARTKSAFLVADRKVGWRPAALSIAATWIWAPALFVAAQKAYLEGWVGVFWFTVPNIATLVFFAWFAERVRRRMPDGFTFAGYVRDRLSRRSHAAYLVAFVTLATFSFSVQLLAGGLIVSTLTGISFAAVTVALASIAVAYSLFSGLKASIVTDYLQMVLIAVVGLIAAPWIVSRAGGWSTVQAGLGGVSGEYTSLWSGPGAAVFFSFGLATTIGLMSGPFGDQTFWQRAFAVKRGQVRKAFYVGAVIFGIVPVTMSLLGFAAAGAGVDVEAVVGTTQLTNLAAVLTWLPLWTVVPFTFFLLSGLVSTLDSNLAAISSLAGHDLVNRATERRRVKDTLELLDGTVPAGAAAAKGDELPVSVARWSMVVLAVAATAIANVPGITIVALFVFYGILRASTLMPTILLLAWRRHVSEPGVFWGIVTALTIGLPVFAYGNFTGQPPFIVAGSLLVIVLSGGITWLASIRAETPRMEDWEFEGEPAEVH